VTTVNRDWLSSRRFHLKSTEDQLQVLRLVVECLLDIRGAVEAREADEDVERVCSGIRTRVLIHTVGPTDDGRDRRGRVHRIRQFEIVTVDRLEGSSRLRRRIPNLETKFLGTFTKKVLGTVLVLINSIQDFGNCVDRNGQLIGEHARFFLGLARLCRLPRTQRSKTRKYSYLTPRKERQVCARKGSRDSCTVFVMRDLFHSDPGHTVVRCVNR